MEIPDPRVRRVGTKADGFFHTDDTPIRTARFHKSLRGVAHLFLFVPRLALVPRARRWCHHHRSFSLRLDDDAHPLWRNELIDRRLPPDARRLFVDALVLDGAAAWLDGDPGPKSKCLVFWRSQDAWCDELCLWAAQSGLEGQIVTLHEVAGGANTGGPPALEGAPFEFLANVAARLEQRDKGAFVAERGEDDAGIKFF